MITVEFTGSISKTRQNVFTKAAKRWDCIVETAFDPVTFEGRTFDGIVIEASIEDIDDEGGILGQAGPTLLRPENQLPAMGVMQFDLADIMKLEQDDSFEDVILHEMGHVLGFGTLWARMGLIAGSGTDNPQFSGTKAAQEYSKLSGGTTNATVPLANTGGDGTREGHWRELVFGDELLTGFLSGSHRPISRVSIAAFEDMGYQVNYAEADPFSLPTFRQLAEQGVPEAVRACHLCRMGRPDPIQMG